MKYVLMLNDMRSPNIENLEAVRVSADRQELVDWYNAQPVEPHKDGQWGKKWAAGSPLEWFNEGDMSEPNAYWGGIYEAPNSMTDEQLMAARLSKW